jgi:hypothetical protein
VERIRLFAGLGLQDLANIFGKTITFTYSGIGGGRFLKNARYCKQDYTVSKPCRAVSEIFAAMKTCNITELQFIFVIRHS